MGDMTTGEPKPELFAHNPMFFPQCPMLGIPWAYMIYGHISFKTRSPKAPNCEKNKLGSPQFNFYVDVVFQLFTYPLTLKIFSRTPKLFLIKKSSGY